LSATDLSHRDLSQRPRRGPLASLRTTARPRLPIPSRRLAALPPTRSVIPIIENMMVLCI
jgi:hypothetical protein